MIISSVNILLLITLFSSFNVLKTVAFYGDPDHQITIPSTFGSSAITVDNKIYLIGGYRYLANTSVIVNTDVSIMTFSSNGTLQLQTITPKNPPTSCSPCAGYALPDGETIVLLNVAYPAYNMTADDNSTAIVNPGGLGFYHTSNNSYTYGRSPEYSDVYSLLRIDYCSAISSDKKFAYIGWGSTPFNNTNDVSTKMLKYEISNSSNIQSIETDVVIRSGCSVTLPSGEMVVAFGINEEMGLYNTTQVIVFDTNTDKFSWKQVKADRVAGTFPVGRIHASCTLGPDNSTIYYYGGSDVTIDIQGQQNLFNVTLYNEIAMLDTKNWVWVLPKNIAGLKPLPASRTSMALFDRNKLLITTGMQGTTATGSVAVLNNVPLSNPSNDEANRLQWFTNNPRFDNLSENYGLSNGAIAGISIAALVFISLLLIALWIFVPATKKIAAYIQQDLIWSPRSGEPLWAETSRLLVRFILLFLFLAFIAYVIWKSVNSATVSQHTSTPVDFVLAPDIRFCFDGFDQSNASISPFVTCNFRNGTNCSGNIRPLNLTNQSPVYTDYFGDISCFLFLPGPSYYIQNDIKGYSDSAGTKMMFNFFAQNTTADITRGVIYIDFHPPGYDPNTVVYGLGESKLSDDQIDQWVISEQANNAVDTIILKQTVRSTASYTLTTVKTLKPNDGWNYIGFSSNYDEYVRISGSFKEVPQNPELMPLDFNTKPIAQLTVQPSAFTENSDVDQRVFTLLNAFAQAGGVLGLFVAVQTILFGFRPQSPWGIVHRWSFGKLRVKLTDRLANYFDRMGTPVPLVNPVSNRLSNVNGQNYFKNTDNTYVPLGADTPSASDPNDINDHENRVHRVEERLQLMELLLKSYYLNDEVFRSLDQAVKRGNEEKRRRSVFMSAGDSDTDSALNNNGLVNEDLIVNTTKDQLNGSSPTDLTRRPSSTVFPQQRETYQPRSPTNPTEFLDDEERGIFNKKG